MADLICSRGSKVFTPGARIGSRAWVWHQITSTVPTFKCLDFYIFVGTLSFYILCRESWICSTSKCFFWFDLHLFMESFCVVTWIHHQILEAEGVTVPEDVSCILQVVSEYLKEPCPITSLSGSQGPTHTEGLKHTLGGETESKGRRDTRQVDWVLVSVWRCEQSFVTTDDQRLSLLDSKVKRDSSTECCLSLCQAVSFLPVAEDDEEMMMRKEDGRDRRMLLPLTHTHTHTSWFLLFSKTSHSPAFDLKV